MVGQREVHIVAAQQDVIADRQAGKLHLAPLLGNGDEGKIGGAAADIDDQDDVAFADVVTEPLAHSLDPGIKRGLGLFEQGDVFEAGVRGRRERQLARRGIEGGGNGQDDLLSGDGMTLPAWPRAKR